MRARISNTASRYKISTLDLKFKRFKKFHSVKMMRYGFFTKYLIGIINRNGMKVPTSKNKKRKYIYKEN